MAQKTKQRELVAGKMVIATALLTGEPVKRIFCKKTGRLVGFLYQWNNGDLQPAWLDVAMAEVRYEPISDAA